MSDSYEVTEWSVIEIEKSSEMTLGKLISELENKTGLKVWDIFMEEECLLLQMSLLSKS